MKQIDKCSSCKYLIKETKYSKKTFYQYSYLEYACNQLHYYLSIDNYDIELVEIDDPEDFGCIAWEAKDE